jgi:cytochrome c-type biogenesis protein CcmF
MTDLGEALLLVSFVSAGYAAFAALVEGRGDGRRPATSGIVAAWVAVAALTVVVLLLARALVSNDFRFDYVAQYSSLSLPWYYFLSALWVGQAGSMLLWTWLLGLVALGYRFVRHARDVPLRQPAFAVLMVYFFFLVSVMLFGADPMTPSLSTPKDGAGLGPELQHPAMLAHPPVVFLAYACWAVPFALAVSALATRRLDAGWLREARP